MMRGVRWDWGGNEVGFMMQKREREEIIWSGGKSVRGLSDVKTEPLGAGKTHYPGLESNMNGLGWCIHNKNKNKAKIETPREKFPRFWNER